VACDENSSVTPELRIHFQIFQGALFELHNDCR
jgi:hypothetical protein